MTLQAQQPFNNVVRVAIQALAAVLGGTQSLHTNGYDEALALPTAEAATLALRTQQVIAHESGVTTTADPLGGSYYVEHLTCELERRAAEVVAKVDSLGGAAAAIARLLQDEIARSARVESCRARRDRIVGATASQTARRPRRVPARTQSMPGRAGAAAGEIRRSGMALPSERALAAIGHAAPA